MGIYQFIANLLNYWVEKYWKAYLVNISLDFSYVNVATMESLIHIIDILNLIHLFIMKTKY